MKKLVVFAMAIVAVVGAKAYAVTCGCGDWVTLLNCATPTNWYRMGEPSGTTMVDTASGFDGTYHGGFTLAQPGIPGLPTNTAVSFNGTTGYADVPFIASERPSAALGNGWTVIAWFKPTALGDQMLVNMIDTATPYVWQLLALNSGAMYFDLKNDAGSCGGGIYGSMTGGTYTAGKWNMAAATTLGLNATDLSRMRLYLNGALITENTSFSGDICTGTTSMNVARVSNNTFFYGGVMDEVVFFWEIGGAGLAEIQPGPMNAFYQAGVSGSNCDWPYRADRPKLPKFRDDGYMNRLVAYGYNSGLFSVRAKRPQFFDLGYMPLFPPGNLH